MRLIISLAVLAFMQTIMVTSAIALPFNAGVKRISATASDGLDVLVWYPTLADEETQRVGPFEVSASAGADVASGVFPVVLLSHGGGKTGGNPLLLSWLSADLARQGYVVAAPFHRTSGFLQRPDHLATALRMVTEEPRFRNSVAPERLGVVGFSLGGAVGLVVAGGTPDFGYFAIYCKTHPEDVRACGGGPQQDPESPAAEAPTPARNFPVLPVKALVLLDPLGAAFSPTGLQDVTMPVMIIRALESALGIDNTEGLAGRLPVAPALDQVGGGHFVFTEICTSELQRAEPALCEDPPAIDRGAVHKTVQSAVTAFFHENL